METVGITRLGEKEKEKQMASVGSRSVSISLSRNSRPVITYPQTYALNYHVVIVSLTTFAASSIA